MTHDATEHAQIGPEGGRAGGNPAWSPVARGLPASTEHPRHSTRCRWLVGEPACVVSPGRYLGRSRARQAQRHMLRSELLQVRPRRRMMALFLETSGNVLLPARGSEDPRQQFLAANSTGWGTSTPTRPERHENEAAGRRSTRNSKPGRRGSPRRWTGRPGGSLVLEGALNAS